MSLLSVVIAARDEEPSVGDVVGGVREVLGADVEILVVDDASRDATGRVARRAGARVLAGPGRGKGAAMREGIAASRGERLVFIDGDGQHEPLDLPPLLACPDPLVLGSRAGGSAPWQSILGNRLLTAAFNGLYGLDLADTQTGLRVIDGALARSLSLRCDGYGFEMEVLVRVAHRGLAVSEVPVVWRSRAAGRSGVRRLRDGALILACLARSRGG